AMLLKARRCGDLPRRNGNGAQVGRRMSDACGETCRRHRRPGLARATRPPPGFLMSVEVQYSASAAAARAIADLGRTEHVQFSPSSRRLAVAAFHHNRIAVFEVEISRSAGKPQVALNSVVEIAAETLKGPHGLCFLDEDTLVVANREGSVEVYRVPASGAATDASATPRRTVLGGPQ